MQASGDARVRPRHLDDPECGRRGFVSAAAMEARERLQVEELLTLRQAEKAATVRSLRCSCRSHRPRKPGCEPSLRDHRLAPAQPGLAGIAECRRRTSASRVRENLVHGSMGAGGNQRQSATAARHQARYTGIAGKSSKSPWPLIPRLHEERFGPKPNKDRSSYSDSCTVAVGS
jgi:hypothetical protein